VTPRSRLGRGGGSVVFKGGEGIAIQSGERKRKEKRKMSGVIYFNGLEKAGRKIYSVWLGLKLVDFFRNLLPP
jgi:hypothetical protein